VIVATFYELLVELAMRDGQTTVVSLGAVEEVLSAELTSREKTSEKLPGAQQVETLDILGARQEDQRHEDRPEQ